MRRRILSGGTSIRKRFAAEGIDLEITTGVALLSCLLATIANHRSHLPGSHHHDMLALTVFVQ